MTGFLLLAEGINSALLALSKESFCCIVRSGLNLLFVYSPEAQDYRQP